MLSLDLSLLHPEAFQSLQGTVEEAGCFATEAKKGDFADVASDEGPGRAESTASGGKAATSGEGPGGGRAATTSGEVSCSGGGGRAATTCGEGGGGGGTSGEGCGEGSCKGCAAETTRSFSEEIFSRF